jgi:hypothetical protein
MAPPLPADGSPGKDSESSPAGGGGDEKGTPYGSPAVSGGGGGGGGKTDRAAPNTGRSQDVHIRQARSHPLPSPTASHPLCLSHCVSLTVSRAAAPTVSLAASPLWHLLSH